MDVRTGWLIGGLVLGSVIMSGVFCAPGSSAREAYEAKRACEAALPRNQTCKIIAVPKPLPEPPGGDDENL